MARKSLVPAGYPALLARVKERVRTAKIQAAVPANRELILLYWDSGHAIVEAQKDKGYGRRVVEVLSVDLRREFPTMTGLSALNLWRMRAFYLAYASNQKLSQPVTESDFRRHRIVKQTVSEIVAQPVRDSSPSILSQPVTESAGAIELITSLPWGQTLCSRKKLSNSVRAFGTPEPRWKTAGHEACLSFRSNRAFPNDRAGGLTTSVRLCLRRNQTWLIRRSRTHMFLTSSRWMSRPANVISNSACSTTFRNFSSNLVWALHLLAGNTDWTSPAKNFFSIFSSIICNCVASWWWTLRWKRGSRTAPQGGGRPR